MTSPLSFMDLFCPPSLSCNSIRTENKDVFSRRRSVASFFKRSIDSLTHSNYTPSTMSFEGQRSPLMSFLSYRLPATAFLPLMCMRVAGGQRPSLIPAPSENGSQLILHMYTLDYCFYLPTVLFETHIEYRREASLILLLVVICQISFSPKESPRI